MLNELREYEIWATGKNTRWDTRFKDGNRGLRRPLLIIARHFLFEKDETNPDFDRAEKALKAWLGKEDSEDPEIHALFNGVKKNIDSIEIAKKSKSTFDKEKAYSSIQQKEYSYSSKRYQSSKNKPSKENAIWIEDIIVQASVDGKLKDMCLVADTDVFDGIIDCRASKSSVNFYKKRDRVLKIIAEYMLSGGKEDIPVKFDSITLSGWFDQSRFPDNLNNDKVITKDGDEICEDVVSDHDEDKSNNNHFYVVPSSIIKHFSIVLTNTVKKRIENDPDYLKNHKVYLDKPGRIFEVQELSNFDL